jgi:hypothetical protein
MSRLAILRQNHRNYYGGTNHKSIKIAAIGDFEGAEQAIKDGDVYRKVVAAHPKVAEVSLSEYLAEYQKKINPQIGGDILRRKSLIPLYLLASEIEIIQMFR